MPRAFLVKKRGAKRGMMPVVASLDVGEVREVKAPPTSPLSSPDTRPTDSDDRPTDTAYTGSTGMYNHSAGHTYSNVTTATSCL